MTWTYGESDPALMLFTAAVQRFHLTFPSGSRVLELGCAESDWLERMHAADPTLQLTGVDARAEGHRGCPGVQYLVGDAMNPELFPEHSFDRIVMLGALEHFGLGYYGDPIDEDGDTKTMRNVARWLKPGGAVYFDVPYQPRYRVADNRHFRMYDEDALWDRLHRPFLDAIPRRRWVWPHPYAHCQEAYSLPEPDAGRWVSRPRVERTPYWFVAMLLELEC